MEVNENNVEKFNSIKNMSIGNDKIEKKTKGFINISDKYKTRIKKAVIIAISSALLVTYSNNALATKNFRDKINNKYVKTPDSIFVLDDLRTNYTIYEAGCEIGDLIIEEKVATDVYNSANGYSSNDEDYIEYNINDKIFEYIGSKANMLVKQGGLSKGNALSDDENMGWLNELYDGVKITLNNTINYEMNNSFIEFLKDYNITNRKGNFNYLTDKYEENGKIEELSNRKIVKNFLEKSKEYKVDNMMNTKKYYINLLKSVFGDNYTLSFNSSAEGVIISNGEFEARYVFKENNFMIDNVQSVDKEGMTR